MRFWSFQALPEELRTSSAPIPPPDLQNATDVHSPPTTLEGALGNPKIPGPEQLLTCAFSFAMFWNWKHVHPVELKLLGDFPKPKCPEYMLLVHPIELELFGDSPKPECPDYMVLTSYKLIWANAKLGLSNLSKLKQMPSMGFLVGAHLMKCQAWTFKSEQVWARLCFQIPKHLGRLMASLMTNLMVPPILLKAYVMLCNFSLLHSGLLLHQIDMCGLLSHAISYSYTPLCCCWKQQVS